MCGLFETNPLFRIIIIIYKICSFKIKTKIEYARVVSGRITDTICYLSWRRLPKLIFPSGANYKQFVLVIFWRRTLVPFIQVADIASAKNDANYHLGPISIWEKYKNNSYYNKKIIMINTRLFEKHGFYYEKFGKVKSVRTKEWKY